MRVTLSVRCSNADVSPTIAPPANGSISSVIRGSRLRSQRRMCGTSHVLPPGYLKGLRFGTEATLTIAIEPKLTLAPLPLPFQPLFGIARLLHRPPGRSKITTYEIFKSGCADAPSAAKASSRQTGSAKPDVHGALMHLEPLRRLF